MIRSIVEKKVLPVAVNRWEGAFREVKSGTSTPKVDSISLGRGSIRKIIIFFAPNIIFSVGSCICMLYDLTCQVSLKKSTHSQSYMGYNVAIRCF
jgi:hypothetical protein